MGGLLLGLGVVGMFGIWIYTTVVLFALGETTLAVISLVIPPADIVLPFLVSPMLGFLGLGFLGVAFAGAALSKD